MLAKRSITRKGWLLWSCAKISDLVLLLKPLGATADQYFRVPREKDIQTSCNVSVYHERYSWSKVSKNWDCRDRGSIVWVFWWGKIVVEVNFDLRLKSSSWLTLFEKSYSHSQNGSGVYFSQEDDGLTIRSPLSYSASPRSQPTVLYLGLSFPEIAHLGETKKNKFTRGKAII